MNDPSIITILSGCEVSIQLPWLVAEWHFCIGFKRSQHVQPSIAEQKSGLCLWPTVSQFRMIIVRGMVYIIIQEWAVVKMMLEVTGISLRQAISFACSWFSCSSISPAFCEQYFFLDKTALLYIYILYIYINKVSLCLGLNIINNNSIWY